jgi:hypothetical protein
MKKVDKSGPINDLDYNADWLAPGDIAAILNRLKQQIDTRRHNEKGR